MGLSLFFLPLILLAIQLTDVLGSCPISDEKPGMKYMMEQNQILYNACMNKEHPHFTPIPFENWQNFNESSYRRAFQLISSYIEYDAHMKKEFPEETSVRPESCMSNIYHNAKVCLYEKDSTTSNEEGCIKKWPTDINEAFTKENNEEERKHYWTAWREATGKEIRQCFEENYKSIMNTFSDNQYWLLEYETAQDELFKDIDEAWNKLLPLYKQLHAYIRRQLIKKYGDKKIQSNGPIPEHLLDLIAKDWWGMKSSVLPDTEELELPAIMQEQNMDISKLIEICEKFYESLGFPRLGEEFWNNLKQLDKTESNCENSVFAGCDRVDSRMTSCHTEGDGYDFFYYMIQNLISVYHQKWNSQHRECGWPKVLNGFPNPGFESGMKGVVDISVSTGGFKKDLGFSNTNSWASDINHLLKMALWSFVNLQYYYSIAKWKLDLSKGTIQQHEMNTKWWEYSLNYRGVCPPVRRDESNFDPGALPQVAENLPFVNDFLGVIYQFQFHKALCKVAGRDVSLHSCDIFGSKEAGDRIRKIMEIGKSKPWQEAMRVITDGESTKLDAQPLLDYYKPLYEWLVKQNENENIGWESDDATICP